MRRERSHPPPLPPRRDGYENFAIDGGAGDAGFEPERSVISPPPLPPRHGRDLLDTSSVGPVQQNQAAIGGSAVTGSRSAGPPPPPPTPATNVADYSPSKGTSARSGASSGAVGGVSSSSTTAASGVGASVGVGTGGMGGTGRASGSVTRLSGPVSKRRDRSVERGRPRSRERDKQNTQTNNPSPRLIKGGFGPSGPQAWPRMALAELAAADAAAADATGTSATSGTGSGASAVAPSQAPAPLPASLGVGVEKSSRKHPVNAATGIVKATSIPVAGSAVNHAGSGGQAAGNRIDGSSGAGGAGVMGSAALLAGTAPSFLRPVGNAGSVVPAGAVDPGTGPTAQGASSAAPHPRAVSRAGTGGATPNRTRAVTQSTPQSRRHTRAGSSGHPIGVAASGGSTAIAAPPRGATSASPSSTRRQQVGAGNMGATTMGNAGGTSSRTTVVGGWGGGAGKGQMPGQMSGSATATGVQAGASSGDGGGSGPPSSGTSAGSGVPVATTGRVAIAKFEYVAQGTEQLSFKVGDIVQLHTERVCAQV